MLGDRLSSLREEARLSLREFADRVGECGYSVSHSAVRQYESRASVPSGYLRAVIRAFDVDPIWLLSGPDGVRGDLAGGGEAGRAIGRNGAGPLTSERSSRAGAPGDDVLRVLLVEDNPGDARLVEAHLAEADLALEILRVGSLEEARSRLNDGPPDLCFLDLGLPDSAGLETVERFRGFAGDLPVVVLTGRSDPGVEAATIRAGADDFLVKDEIGPVPLARTIRHVLERHRARRERRAAEERWAKLFAVSPVAKVLSEAETGRLIEVNDAFVEMFGQDREQILGRSALELGYWDDPERRRELVTRVHAEGYFEGEEAWFRNVEGRRGRMLLACRRLEMSGEGHLLWTVQDITDRIRRERALAERVKEQSCLYDVSRILHDEGTPLGDRLQAVVDRLPEGWQYPDVTVARLRVDEETYRSAPFAEAESALRVPVRVEGEAVGEVAVGYTAGRPDEDEGPFLAEERRLLEKIAEHVEVELSRQKTRREMLHVVETMGEAVAIADPDGTISFANSAARRLLGDGETDVVGRNLEELAPRMRTLAGAPHPPGELPFRTVMRTGEPVSGFEHLVQRPDGGDPVVVSVNAAPIRDESAATAGVVLTIRDVTERHRADRWRHLLERSVEEAADGVIITDREGTIVWANPAFTEMTGYEMDEVRGENPSILKSGEQDEAVYEELWSTILAGETWRGEIVNRRKDGGLYTERQSIVPLRFRGREISHFVAIKEDVTEEKTRQERLEETTERLHGLLDTAAGIIFRLRLSDMAITYVTPNVEELVGYPRERWTDSPGFWTSLMPEKDLERILGSLERALESGATRIEEEYRLRHADGAVHWYRGIARFEFDDAGEPVGFVGTSVNVTERHELEEQLRYQALHDPLTDLANRTLLTDRLEQGLARVRRHGEGMAIVMLDLDRFKKINESLGHTAGDRVLVEVARRLENGVRGEDTVARWGGDEFLLVLTGLEARRDLERARARLMERFRQSVRVMDREIGLHVSMGAVLCGLPGDADSVDPDHPEDLIRYADRALRHAKGTLEGVFHLHRPEADGPGTGDPLAREQELRRGLEQGEFEPFYQPIVRLDTGEVWGLEPLARWRHPERGVVRPDEFVGLAEETGLIQELGRQIIARTFRDAAEWELAAGRGAEDLRVTLNVSGRQFDEASLVDLMAEELERSSLPPERVLVEVTETSIMRATRRIEELRELGVGVLIDDFGTGYSSLLYLRDLPVDGLKIDMSFVQGLGQGRGNGAIVETTLTLGRAMGLLVVAEGIETEHQLRRLRQMDCVLGQGYHFARPMPVDETEAYLADG